MLTDSAVRSMLSQFGLPCVPCGLNADWSVSAWYLGTGRPNHNDTPQRYLLDNEDGTYSIALRHALPNGEDVIIDLFRGSLKSVVRSYYAMPRWTDYEWNLVGKPVVDRAKREVLADIASGVVPTSVRTFADLHTYVDANYYGGAFESEFDGTDETVAFWNRVQDEVDGWLRTGRPS